VQFSSGAPFGAAVFWNLFPMVLVRHMPHKEKGNAMSKKNVARDETPLSPRPVVKEPDTVFLVREGLDERQDFSELTAARAGGEPVLVPRAIPAKPLTPLAELWPDAAPPPKGPSRPTPPPAQPAHQTPAKAAAFSPAPASTLSAPKPPVQPVPALPLEQATVDSKGPLPTALAPFRTVKVCFSLFEPAAKRVSLCGDFNQWSAEATPMKRKEGGHWETTVALQPGRHQYKFIADGYWKHDPVARENVPNEHGSLNSVLEVRG
jgi:hypothetical protein